MRPATVVFALFVGAACREPPAHGVAPAVQVPGGALDFGALRLGDDALRTVVVRSTSAASVRIRELRVDGDAAFTVLTSAAEVPALQSAELTLRFAPVLEGDAGAELVIASDDAERPEVRLPLRGRGVAAQLSVQFTCAPDCAATLHGGDVTFAPTPVLRARPIDVATLPRLVLRNTGEVDAVVQRITLEGAGYAFVGNALVPAAGRRFPPGTSQSVPLLFQPTVPTPGDWPGSVRVTSDVGVSDFALHGSVRENLPPNACAGLSRVGARELAWGATPLVPPGAVVTLSALSSPDDTRCTTDPEDGRVALGWHWRLTEAPQGNTAALLEADTPTPRLRPVLVGRYAAELTVTDAQANASTATVTFDVGERSALVAQLDWSGTPLVDLDLHLVRPGATPFDVHGDVNGYSALLRDAGVDWGAQLRFDDTGDGPLVENITAEALRCDAGACRYELYVHGFRDRRPPAPASTCTLDGACLDGERCQCASGEACVADEAPPDAGARGTGRCLPGTPATVRVFVDGATTSSLDVPLIIGAPCQLLHVATVTSTDAGVTVTAASGAQRFGTRQAASLQCAPPYVAQPR